jgi:membrane protein
MGRWHPKHGTENHSQQPRQYSLWHLGGLSLRELVKRVWQGLTDDDLLGRSAQLSYYGFFSLFPALILFTALLGIMAGPGTQIYDLLVHYLGKALSPSVARMLHGVLDESLAASGGGKITFGLLALLWTASSAMAAVQDTLNVVYDIEERRPLWKARLSALAITVVCSLLLLLTMAVFLYGTMLVDFIADQIGLGEGLRRLWRAGEWPVAVFSLSLAFAIIYSFAPDFEPRRWKWLTPGSVFAMITWVLATFGFRLYLRHFNSFTRTYGSLGAVIILLSWFYVTGLMVLLGGEVNAAIECAAADHGVPGARRKRWKTQPAKGPVSSVQQHSISNR